MKFAAVAALMGLAEAATTQNDMDIAKGMLVGAYDLEPAEVEGNM